MRHLTTFILVTLAVFLGSAGVSAGAEPIKGLCPTGTKHSHLPVAGKCSLNIPNPLKYCLSYSGMDLVDVQILVHYSPLRQT